MSWRTPTVSAGMLHESFGAVDLAVGSAAWYAWLAEDIHRSFHFTHPTGDFTARKERKQRGQWYWVAYRQVHGKLYKAYLGKSETLSEAHLCEVAQTLSRAASEVDEHIT